MFINVGVNQGLYIKDTYGFVILWLMEYFWDVLSFTKNKDVRSIDFVLWSLLNGQVHCLSYIRQIPMRMEKKQASESW